MKKLHVIVDGSWLYKASAPNAVLASKTENTERAVRIDFGRLNEVLLEHVRAFDPECTELGKRYLSTSVFTLPDDFDSWPDDHDGLLPEHIEVTKRAVQSRNHFVDSALAAGYSEDAVYRPLIKSWIVRSLVNGTYQEKQVDTTVVALLVREAIVNPDDYHCVITGDADILPAIRVAYPDYSENVFLATTHPDELQQERRQTSFSFLNFNFRMDPLYLQDCVADFIQGDHVYTCAHCHKVFTRPQPIPRQDRPCCRVCHAQRT